MSWDATLYEVTEVTKCHECGQQLPEPRKDRGEAGWWNYTRNVTPMIAAAWEQATGKPIEQNWWAMLNGMDGPAGREHIATVVKALEADPEKFRAMNPPNGWGDYDSLLGVLRQMRDAAEDGVTYAWRTAG